MKALHAWGRHVPERRPLSNNNKLLSLARKVHRLTLVVVYIYSSKIHNHFILF